MLNIDFWDGLLLAVAAMIAVGSLTKMMRARRDMLVSQVQSQIDAEAQRKKAAAKRKKQAA